MIQRVSFYNSLQHWYLIRLLIFAILTWDALECRFLPFWMYCFGYFLSLGPIMRVNDVFVTKCSLTPHWPLVSSTISFKKRNSNSPTWIVWRLLCRSPTKGGAYNLVVRISFTYCCCSSFCYIYSFIPSCYSSGELDLVVVGWETELLVVRCCLVGRSVQFSVIGSSSFVRRSVSKASKRGNEQKELPG